MALSQDQTFQLELVFSGCEERDCQLTDFESSFIQGLKSRYETYKGETFISAKQWRIVEQVYNKVMA